MKSKTRKKNNNKKIVDLRQSPVNIYTKKNRKLKTKDYLKIMYLNKVVKARKRVFHKNIQYVPKNKSLFVKYNNYKFRLIQYHFHKPSEHSVNNKKTAMSIHLVHKNIKNDNYLVISFMIKNDNIDGIFDEGIEMKNQAEFKLNEEDVGSCFYTYPGSLTTHPFTSNVRWVVFKKLQSSSKTMKWKKKYGRPLRQPLRTVRSEITYICDK